MLLGWEDEPIVIGDSYYFPSAPPPPRLLRAPAPVPAPAYPAPAPRSPATGALGHWGTGALGHWGTGAANGACLPLIPQGPPPTRPTPTAASSRATPPRGTTRRWCSAGTQPSACASASSTSAPVTTAPRRAPRPAAATTRTPAATRTTTTRAPGSRSWISPTGCAAAGAGRGSLACPAAPWLHPPHRGHAAPARSPCPGVRAAGSPQLRRDHAGLPASGLRQRRAAALVARQDQQARPRCPHSLPACAASRAVPAPRRAAPARLPAPEPAGRSTAAAGWARAGRGSCRRSSAPRRTSRWWPRGRARTAAGPHAPPCCQVRPRRQHRWPHLLERPHAFDPTPRSPAVAPADGGMTWWCRQCERRPAGSRPFDGARSLHLEIKSKSRPGALACSVRV
jgi:hypothetical protein